MKTKARALDAPTQLLVRIEQLRAEIEEAIDARVNELARDTYCVPKAILKGMLMRAGDGCECRAFKAMKEGN
jgi:hypothetical protein